MKLEAMRDEAKLSHAERRDWAENIDNSIRRGSVKQSEMEAMQMRLRMIRQRLPAERAIWRALTLIIEWRERLPKDLIELLEAEL